MSGYLRRRIAMHIAGMATRTVDGAGTRKAVISPDTVWLRKFVMRTCFVSNVERTTSD